MKLHLTPGSGQYLVTGYENDRIFINREPYFSSLVITPQELVTDWEAAQADALTEVHFERILQLQPELVLIGTGKRLRFPHPALFRCLTERQIGVEFMDTQAAARTYNILMAEDRHVVCGLVLEKPEPV